VLAWSLTSDGKTEQAENLYRQLMAQETPDPSDFLNYGYSLWLQGRVNEAAEQLRKYARLVAGKENTATLQLDDRWLKARGISDTEICMMKTLVAMG
jgi:Flp pilus assembly protein TadD